MLSTILTLFYKDLLTELRSKETIVLCFGLAVLLALVAAFGINSAGLNPVMSLRIFPALIWMIFLFGATISIARIFEHDLEHAALEALFISGVSSSLVYTAKVLSAFIVILVSHILAIAMLAGIGDVAIWNAFSNLLLCSLPVIFAYCCLSILLAAISSTSKLKALLLPLLLLPLIFPLLVCGLELFSETIATQQMPLKSQWFSIVLVLDVIYFALGINLYPHTLSD